MLFENLMLLNVSAIQSSFWISGSEASAGPVYVSLVHECDAPMYPSKSVPNVLFRFRSTPHALREAGSVFVYGTLVPGLTRGVQKLVAFGSSSTLPPLTQWFVMLRRWLAKLWIEWCEPSGFEDGRMKMSSVSMSFCVVLSVP